MSSTYALDERIGGRPPELAEDASGIGLVGREDARTLWHIVCVHIAVTGPDGGSARLAAGADGTLAT